MNVSNATVPVIYELGALWDRYGQTKLMNYITSISYSTVGTFLDIAITLDRISKLKVKKFCNFSAYKVSMVGFAFCFLVNYFGYFFVFEPGSRTFNGVITDEGTVIYIFTLWSFTQTKFARTE
jgi:hypothetical protein